MNRRADWRRIRTHLSYTYEEAARALRVHRMTVRQWVKHCGLPVQAERRPHLILGAELKAFLKAQRESRKRKCGPGEMYCLKCRMARKPVEGLLEHRTYSESRGALIGFCECGALMHRFVSNGSAALAAAEFNVQLEDRHESLGDSGTPPLNCHSNGARTHGQKQP
jgi:excisionase family DNA binding protein